MTLRTFSYGGGVQSTAALVLAAQGTITTDTFLFADLGRDSENPATLDYLHTHAIPFAQKNSIDLQIVRPTIRGEPVTLRGEITRRQSSYVIPVKFPVSGKGNRRCTYDMKIVPIARWLKQHGATKHDPAVVSLGISTDEMQRMRTSSGFDHYSLDYPLVRLRLYRDTCEQIIADAGLPIPPKSSCFFCPFHSMREWSRLHDQEPELFAEACRIEDELGDRMQAKQGQRVYLSDARIPLRDAVGTHTQLDLEDTCESGFCMT